MEPDPTALSAPLNDDTDDDDDTDEDALDLDM